MSIGHMFKSQNVSSIKVNKSGKGFLVSKETVVLRPWESETKIGFHQKSW